MKLDNVHSVASLYGGFWNHDVKDFCYMTNPYFPPDAFLDDLGLRLKELVKSYPSTNWHLSALVAETLNLTHKEVLIANGASELISAITNRYVTNLAVPVPTFNEYTNRASDQSKRVSPFVTQGDFELDPDQFLQHIASSQANSALIIQPNNPTGTYLPKADLRYLLEALRHLDLIMVDESFIDFVRVESNPSALDMTAEFPNLIILKSLSKNYGIPGLRLGYAASENRERIAQLRQDLPIWNINSMAQFFLEKMGECGPAYLESCDRIQQATQKLYHGLQDVSYLAPYPTHGNFILCRVLNGYSAADLTSDLFDRHRVLVNNCSAKEGLEGDFVRIASRTEEENTELLNALEGLTTRANSSR